MMTHHWLWWHRHDANSSEVLVMFDVTDDFEIVSVSDAAGVDQTLSANKTDALRYHDEAHFDGKLKVANRTMAIAT